MEGVVDPCVGEVVGEGVEGVGEGVEVEDVEGVGAGCLAELSFFFFPFFSKTCPPRADPSNAANAPPLLCTNCNNIF